MEDPPSLSRWFPRWFPHQVESLKNENKGQMKNIVGVDKGKMQVLVLVYITSAIQPNPFKALYLHYHSSISFPKYCLCKLPSSSLSPQKQEFLLLTMNTEMVMVDEIPFPAEITKAKSLSLMGHGITDIEIHFLQIKFNAIEVYLDREVVKHLEQWKGKKGSELVANDDFFEALISAPVEKFFRIVVIKEIKGSQYGVQLESAVRDRLAAIDKYEEEEEEALEKVSEFFQSKYFKKNSVISFSFAPSSVSAEISFTTEGKEESKMTVENANVVEMIQKWYLGGTRGVSQTTIASLAENLGALLS